MGKNEKKELRGVKCENGSNGATIKIPISLGGGGVLHRYLYLSICMSPAAPSLPGSCDQREGEKSIFDNEEGYGLKEKRAPRRILRLHTLAWGSFCR